VNGTAGEPPFEQVQRILRGDRRDVRRFTAGLALIYRVTWTRSDTTITASECSTLLARRRRATKFSMTFVPSAIIELMEGADLTTILGPLRLRLPVSRDITADVWVTPEKNSLLLRSRLRGETVPRVQIDATPPPCPPLDQPPDPPNIHESAATPCLHCGVTANQHRWLHAGELICGACGRSFPRPAR
jgi:hypothetical protein